MTFHGMSIKQAIITVCPHPAIERMSIFVNDPEETVVVFKAAVDVAKFDLIIESLLKKLGRDSVEAFATREQAVQRQEHLIQSEATGYLLHWNSIERAYM